MKRITPNHIKRHIRRWFLIIFRPYYVMEKLSQRKGECKDCGCCVTRLCRNWDDKKHCLRWINLPFICKICPIDYKDMSDFVRKNCGFHW